MPRDPDKAADLAPDEGAEGIAARLAELVDRDHARLFAELCRKAPRDVAEEILAQTYVNVLTRAPASIGGSLGRLQAYVLTTAKNLLANYYRDRGKRRSKLEQLCDEELQTIGSYTRTVRCVLDPRRDPQCLG